MRRGAVLQLIVDHRAREFDHRGVAAIGVIGQRAVHQHRAQSCWIVCPRNAFEGGVGACAVKTWVAKVSLEPIGLDGKSCQGVPRQLHHCVVVGPRQKLVVHVEYGRVGDKLSAVGLWQGKRHSDKG